MMKSSPLYNVLLCFFLSMAFFLNSSLAKADGLYMPKPDDFRPVYNQDAKNKSLQQWDGDEQYWDWVQKFYDGNTITFLGISVHHEEGWTKDCQKLLAGIPSEAVRQDLIKMLNTLGRKIAGEWAKDNGARKINTDDLQGWGRKMKRAKAKDDETGSKVKATIQQIDREADEKLSKK